MLSDKTSVRSDRQSMIANGAIMLEGGKEESDGGDELLTSPARTAAVKKRRG